jgi:hypothetical protein
MKRGLRLGREGDLASMNGAVRVTEEFVAERSSGVEIATKDAAVLGQSGEEVALGVTETDDLGTDKVTRTKAVSKVGKFKLDSRRSNISWTDGAPKRDTKRRLLLVHGQD